jgi:DNA repair protein RecO (recombination protein O)
MLKTRGFIIRKIPYGDNSAILKIYTEEEGLLTFMAHGMQRKKGGNAPLSQLMNFVELVYYPSGANSEIHRLKEIQPVHGFAGIQQNPVKIQVLLFSAELLNHLLQERAPDPELFSLLNTFYDSLNREDVFVHQPLWFLLQLMKNQGLAPHLNMDEQWAGFSPETGSMIPKDTLLPHEKFLSLEGSRLAKELLQTQADNIKSISSKAEVRHETLDSMALFCEMHLLHGKKLRSIEIIREVLRS